MSTCEIVDNKADFDFDFDYRDFTKQNSKSMIAREEEMVKH